MFKSVYYDEYNNKMHLWEIKDGKTTHEVIDHQIAYYIEDKTKTSETKDIYGTHVNKMFTDNKKNLKDLKLAYGKLFESNLSEEVKFLHERYKDQKDEIDYQQYKVANIDIEIQGENEFPKPELAKYPINLITIDDYRNDKITTFGLQPYTGEAKTSNYIYCETEELLLQSFIQLMRKEKFAIGTGWYCLDKKSSLWLQDKIIKVGDSSVGNKNYNGSTITNYVNTGTKIGKKIKLVNGMDIIASDEHIFPVYSKKVEKYANENLDNTSKDMVVSDIEGEILKKENDLYLRVEIRDNKNDDLTYKKYIIENLSTLLSYKYFDFVLSEKLVNKYKNDIKNIAGKYFKYSERYFDKLKYTKLKDIVSIGDILEMFEFENNILFAFNKNKINIDISETINVEFMRILGLVYTDGSMYYNKQNGNRSMVFYNTDKRLMWDFRNLIVSNKVIKTKPKIHWAKDKNGSINFAFNGKFALLSSMIYGTNYKKSINTTMLSMCSLSQFTSFFGGCVDGDGWVRKTKGHGVGFCNYIDGDIEKMFELLFWNGVICTKTKTAIHLKEISNNHPFIYSLGLKQSYKRKLYKEIKYKDYKNTFSRYKSYSIHNTHILVKIKSVETVGSVDMCDITTTNSYFNTNFGIKTHNCNQFDWPYIINRCKNLEIDYTKISPISKVKCNQKKDGSWKVEIAGLYILDGMALYKKFSYQNQPSYNLNYIGMQEVNDGKLDYDGQINDLWKRDWNLFVDYNVQDCLLVRKIEYKRKFVDLAINLGVQTRTPFDKVYSTISIVEGYLLRYLHRDNIIFPDRLKMSEDDEEESIEGGFVFVIPVFYVNCISGDATSLYPHEIMMNNISPETKVLNPNPEQIKDLIRTPVDGVYYRKDIKGILPKMVSDIFKERKHFQALKKEAKKAGDEEMEQYNDSQQLIAKILINSVYGVLLNQYFHFYDADNGAVITAGGRDAIQYISNCINTFFHTEFHKVAKKLYPSSTLKKGDISSVIVVVNDTDSFYMNADEIYNGCNTGLSFLDWCLDFEKRFFTEFLEKCMTIYGNNYNTTNMIYFKREKIITKMYVQAKKKYITQIVANEGDIYDPPETKVTGVEINKSDLCAYSRKKLKDLADLMFEGDAPDKEKMTKFVRKAFQEFKKQPIEQISSPKGVNDYDKYSIPLQLPLLFKPHTPMAHKSAMIYNYIVKEFKLPLQEVSNGTKIKYIYVYEQNKFKTNVIGYVGNYPKEFNKHFQIDIDTQFEKQFLNVAQRMFDTLGFGTIQMKDSKINKLFE